MWIEAEVEVANFGLLVAGLANRIKRGAIFWIKAAVELQTETFVVHWLKRFECHDGIFPAANRNKVSAKIVADNIKCFLNGTPKNKIV